jgi:hypothetical protein
LSGHRQLEIRRKLEVNGNINEFMAQMQKQQKRMTASLDSLIKALGQDHAGD